MSVAESYRRAERFANGPCPIESGVIGLLADHECEHGNLPGEDECGCWPKPPNPLKRRRLMLGFTISRLAAVAKVNPDTISRLEAGERPICNTAFKLAAALGCEPEWLFPNEPRVRNADFSLPSRFPALRQRAFELRATGATQRQIARKLGVAQTTVSGWLRGART